MEINGTLNMQISGVRIKHYKDENRFATLSLLLEGDETYVKEALGEEIATMAFAGSRIDEEENVTFPYLKLEPSAQCAPHKIKFFNTAVESAPEIKSITPKRKDLEVSIAIDVMFQVGAANKIVVADIATSVGSKANFEFGKLQLSLPLQVKKGPFGNKQPIQVSEQSVD